MKAKFAILALQLAMIPSTALRLLPAARQAIAAGVTSVSASAPFTGVWRSLMDGMPDVTLVIADEDGSLSGAVLFYFHTRRAVNDSWTTTPGLPEPMFRLCVEGVTIGRSSGLQAVEYRANDCKLALASGFSNTPRP